MRVRGALAGEGQVGGRRARLVRPPRALSRVRPRRHADPRRRRARRVADAAAAVALVPVLGRRLRARPGAAHAEGGPRARRRGPRRAHRAARPPGDRRRRRVRRTTSHRKAPRARPKRRSAGPRRRSAGRQPMRRDTRRDRSPRCSSRTSRTAPAACATSTRSSGRAGASPAAPAARRPGRGGRDLGRRRRRRSTSAERAPARRAGRAAPGHRRSLGSAHAPGAGRRRARCVGAADADALLRELADAPRRGRAGSRRAPGPGSRAGGGRAAGSRTATVALGDGIVLRDDRVALTADAPVTVTSVLRIAAAAARHRPSPSTAPRSPGSAPSTARRPGTPRPRRVLRAAARGARAAIPVFEALDHVGVLVRLLPGVGARAGAAATQRIPPLHRRPSPARGRRRVRGDPRRRTASTASVARACAPELLLLGALAARHRQGRCPATTPSRVRTRAATVAHADRARRARRRRAGVAGA